MEIVKIKISDLTPYKNNAKQHPEEQINRIMKSIEEFGMNDPIAVWGKDNIIVEGHGRLEALKKLGYDEVDCIRLDHLSDEERKAYTLAHNKLTMDTDFNIDILNDELDSIDDIDMSDFGFDSDNKQNEIIEDDIPERKEKTKTKIGDIFLLGNHKIMCGDSNDENNIKKLMGEDVAKCLFSSPPYNMNGGMYETYNDNLKSKEYIDFNLEIINKWKKYLKGYLFWNISYNKNARWEFIEILYKIVKIKISDLTPYKNNAKQHPEEQINRIMKSIEEFGMNDPIAVWGKDYIIVEGHGRLEAL